MHNNRVWQLIGLLLLLATAAGLSMALGKYMGAAQAENEWQQRYPFDGIMCDSDIECEEATGYPYEVALEVRSPKYPRLVGIGCEGATAPIYAFNEDHLPNCREIFDMDWDWKERIVK